MSISSICNSNSMNTTTPLFSKSIQVDKTIKSNLFSPNCVCITDGNGNITANQAFINPYPQSITIPAESWRSEIGASTQNIIDANTINNFYVVQASPSIGSSIRTQNFTLAQGNISFYLYFNRMPTGGIGNIILTDGTTNYINTSIDFYDPMNLYNLTYSLGNITLANPTNLYFRLIITGTSSTDYQCPIMTLYSS